MIPAGKREWLQLAARHGGSSEVAAKWWTELQRRHSEAHRRYHTLEHVGEMLDLLPETPDELAAAAWFHDVIYDPRRNDNEPESAAMAQQALSELAFPAPVIERAGQLILATRGHSGFGLDSESLRFLDADLAILGSDPERYRRYAADIRAEYSFLSDDAYRAGRAAVLRNFASRERIFFTAEMASRFEMQARENIRWEIRQLTASSPIPSAPGSRR